MKEMLNAPTARLDVLTVLEPTQPTLLQMPAAQLALLITALQTILAANVYLDNFLMEEHQYAQAVLPTAAPAQIPTLLTQLQILLALLVLMALDLPMDHAFNAQQVNILQSEEHHSVQVVHQDAQLVKLLTHQQTLLVLLVPSIISFPMDRAAHAQKDNFLQEVIKLNAPIAQQDAQIVLEQILQLPIAQLAPHAPLITSIILMEHALNAKKARLPLVESLLIVAHAQPTVPLAITTLLLLA
jgi:hypothetical protein